MVELTTSDTKGAMVVSLRSYQVLHRNHLAGLWWRNLPLSHSNTGSTAEPQPSVQV